jgi:hypothetical protein
VAKRLAKVGHSSHGFINMHGVLHLFERLTIIRLIRIRCEFWFSVRLIRLGISCRRSVDPFAFNYLPPYPAGYSLIPLVRKLFRNKQVTGLPFTARFGKELELSLLKGSGRTVLHCAH